MIQEAIEGIVAGSVGQFGHLGVYKFQGRRGVLVGIVQRKPYVGDES